MQLTLLFADKDYLESKTIIRRAVVRVNTTAAITRWNQTQLICDEVPLLPICRV